MNKLLLASVAATANRITEPVFVFLAIHHRFPLFNLVGTLKLLDMMLCSARFLYAVLVHNITIYNSKRFFVLCLLENMFKERVSAITEKKKHEMRNEDDTTMHSDGEKKRERDENTEQMCG